MTLILRTFLIKIKVDNVEQEFYLVKYAQESKVATKKKLTMNQETPFCPVSVTLKVIGGKWKPAILWHLSEGYYRFGELRRRIPNITQKMLTQQLRELEKDGVITRKVYAEVPPKVEYSLTAYGKTLTPILRQMCRWGEEHRQKVEPPPLKKSA